MGVAANGYASTLSAYRAMAGDFLDSQALDSHGNIVPGDVVGGGLVGVVVENVRR